jgi:hypothetical protein
MLSSGSQMINQSNRMVESAARDINDNIQQEKSADSASFNPSQTVNPSQPTGSSQSVNPIQKQEAIRSQSISSDIDPLIKLQEASQYSRIGASVVQREQDTVGSLLDIHV